MKKVAIISLLMIIIMTVFSLTNKVQAVENSLLSNEVEGKLIEIKKDETKSIEDYKQKYNSDAYGVTAYILNIIRIYSIPFCFLGILAGAIYDYVIGMRLMETKEKGIALMISFITIGVICQILPLVFTIVVKFGRE